MKKLLVITFLILSSASFIPCLAQYTVLYNFTGGIGGASPDYGSLTLSGSTLYGMTTDGGANNKGNIFSVDTNGNGYKDLFDFDGTNGQYPYGSLTLSGNTLYGMTGEGGLNDSGVVFSIGTNGNGYKDLFDFNFGNGAKPDGALTLSGDTLYGMTSACTHGYGNIFSIRTDGSRFSDLFTFTGTNGSNPTGSLTLSGNTLYGMTDYGGSTYISHFPGDGAIFSINTNGSGYSKLYDFDSASGDFPFGSLTLSGNTLYGMTGVGGANNFGAIFSINTIGSGYTDLFDFSGARGGEEPFGSLILSGNTLYGMTYDGGFNDEGNIFSIGTNGKGYVDLFDFNGTNGSNPQGSLILSGNTLYGMAGVGGANRYGVIFKYSITTAGISTMKNTANLINVYPNPSNGIFTIQAKNEELMGKSEIDVYNVLSEKVYSNYQITKSSPKGIPSQNYQIDLSSQPNGVYLYRVISQTGTLVGEGKLIIQK